MMLNKDNQKRPDILELSRIPCIKKHILKFVEDHNCKDEVIAFLDVEEVKQL